MTQHEIHANSTLYVPCHLSKCPLDHTNLDSIILARSETTATALSGCMYLLCTNKDILNCLSQEVHSTFSSDVSITSAQCVSLPYLNAVIKETLWVYPPVATHLPRVVPKGGATVAGEWRIPPGGCMYPENIFQPILTLVVLRRQRSQSPTMCCTWPSWTLSGLQNFSQSNGWALMLNLRPTRKILYSHLCWDWGTVWVKSLLLSIFLWNWLWLTQLQSSISQNARGVI